MIEIFEQKIQKSLVQHGWESLIGTVPLASKQFQTYVGRKEAHIYLQDFGAGSDCYLLAGDYQSEGRNCLEPHMVSIPKSAKDEEIHQLTVQFALKADAVISETYAMRLLKAQ